MPKHRAARARNHLAGGVLTVLGAVVVAALVATGVVVLGQPGADARTAAARPAAADSQVAQLLVTGRTRQPSRDFARQATPAAAKKVLPQRAERRTVLRELPPPPPPWSLPIGAGVYRITGLFGECTSLWSSCHGGVDFAAPYGTAILSVSPGVVTSTGYEGGFGNKTEVTLEDGAQLWYAHQDSFAVSVGETVAAGQVIGYVGLTGRTTGPHLHLELHASADADGQDPLPLLAANGVQP